MSRRLGDVLSEFAEGEGRRASQTPADAGPVVRQLEGLIVRRRAMRASVISLAAVVLVLSSVAGANALMRQDHEPAAVATQVSTDPSASATSEEADGKPGTVGASPSATASAMASPTPTPTPSESAAPTEQAIAPSWDPADAPVQLAVGTTATTLAESVLARPRPDYVREYEWELNKGVGFKILEGPVYDSGYWWYLGTAFTSFFAFSDDVAWVVAADADGNPLIGPAPAQCTDAGFVTKEPTVSSLPDLQTGIVGTWRGCVTTPWVELYEVTITFRDDGTYSATTQPNAEGSLYRAFYYGLDEDSPLKTYALTAVDASGMGSGTIDLLRGGGSVFDDDALSSVRLMGDTLQFDYVHLGRYGPLTYRLYRVG